MTTYIQANILRLSSRQTTYMGSFLSSNLTFLPSNQAILTALSQQRGTHFCCCFYLTNPSSNKTQTKLLHNLYNQYKQKYNNKNKSNTPPPQNRIWVGCLQREFSEGEADSFFLNSMGIEWGGAWSLHSLSWHWKLPIIGPAALSLSIPLLSSVSLWVTALGAAAAATASYTGFNRGLEGTVTLVIFSIFVVASTKWGLRDHGTIEA